MSNGPCIHHCLSQLKDKKLKRFTCVIIQYKNIQLLNTVATSPSSCISQMPLSPSSGFLYSLYPPPHPIPKPPSHHPIHTWVVSLNTITVNVSEVIRQIILVPRGRNPFGQHQRSRPLAGVKTRSPWIMDSLSNLANLIGWKSKASILRMLNTSAPARGLNPWC